MATTFTFPRVVIPVGPRDFGPANVGDAEAAITLNIDRTVAGGLDSLTSASSLGVFIQQSNDGGATWDPLGGGEGMLGGTVLDKFGVPRTTETVKTMLNPGTGRKVMLTATAEGAVSIAVGGSIVTT